MKKQHAALVLALALVACTPSGDGGGPTVQPLVSSEHASGRLWVKGKVGADPLALSEAVAMVLGGYQFGAGSPEVVTTPELVKLGYVLVDPGEADAGVLEDKLRGAKGVREVGREGVSRVIEPWLGVEPGARVVLDPLVGSQWFHAKLGSLSAWDAGYAGSGVIVAVVDTGVQCSHPDVLCSSNGRDFTGGGNATDDRFGHGTHVAGIAAARGSNGQGGSGVAPQARVLPVKVLGNNGYGSDSGIASGIVWATDQGARIINLSLGSDAPSPMMQDALRYATARGVLASCAAGNEGTSTPSYPNSYPECIGVAAGVKDNEGLASWSNWGTNADVGAPGESLLSTCPTSRYCQMSGTSMAAPAFAGVLALALAAGVPSADALTLVKQTGIAMTGRGSGLRRPSIPSLVSALANRVTLTPPPTPTLSVPRTPTRAPATMTPPVVARTSTPKAPTITPGPSPTWDAPAERLTCEGFADSPTTYLLRCAKATP